MFASLIIRADASSQIGTGHIMRCLALGQAWQSNGNDIIFITACEHIGLLQRLENERFKVVPLEQAYPNTGDWTITSQVLAEHSDAWMVLDGYHFEPAYQRRVKESGHRLLLIDDMAHLEHYHADIVLNQNILAEHLKYSVEPNTQLMLGLRYALLRKEFLSWRKWQRTIPNRACKLLVTLGGADPDNQTLKVIRAVQQIESEKIETKIVVGASNPHLKELKAASCGSSSTFKLIHNATNMPELMAWADIAVSAAGSTCWEMAFMGLPNIVLVLAENQQSIAEGLFKAGMSLNMGWFEHVSENQIAEALMGIIFNPDRRRQMSMTGRHLVDGVGSDRVCESLLNYQVKH